MSDYTLGPLPWSEEILRQAYFRNFTDAQKAIQEHPGFAAHRDLCGLKLSLGIFLDAVSELFEAIDAFLIDGQSPGFWTRPAEAHFKKRGLAIQRAVFAAATSALALVDHSRIVKQRIAVAEDEYERELREAFDEDEHRFIQSLRACVSHVRMVSADWQRSYSASGKQTKFLLRPDILFQWDGWDQQARAFIERHPGGINVGPLFRDYRACVERFHKWFRSEVARVSEPQLSEYRQYARMLRRFDTRAWWNLLLDQVTIRRLDPFRYLDRYLTKPELDEVLALPMRSRAQVDRIIEMMDEYGACDEDLRKKAYGAFGVDLPNREA